MKNRTNAPGKIADGNSHAATNWLATTANTRATGRSSAVCANGPSRGPITWPCTWNATWASKLNPNFYLNKKKRKKFKFLHKNRLGFARWNLEPKLCAVNILTKRNCKCYESFIIVAITEEIMSALPRTLVRFLTCWSK